MGGTGRRWGCAGCLALSLAACNKTAEAPPPGPAVSVTAAAGGMVTSADGRARLDIAAGALDRDAEVRLVASEAGDASEDALSAVYAVHFGSAQLRKPAQLTIDVAGSAVNAGGATAVPVVTGRGKGPLWPEDDVRTVFEMDKGSARVVADIRHPGRWWVARGSPLGSVIIEWAEGEADMVAGSAWPDRLVVRGRSDADVIPLVMLASEGQGEVAAIFAPRPERLQGYQDRFEKPVEIAWQCRQPGAGRSQWTASVEYEGHKGAGGHVTVSRPVRCAAPSDRCPVQGHFGRLLARVRAVEDEGCAMRGIDEQLDVTIDGTALSISRSGSDRAAQGVLAGDCRGSAYSDAEQAIYQLACDRASNLCRGRLHVRPTDKTCTELYDIELALPR